MRILKSIFIITVMLGFNPNTKALSTKTTNDSYKWGILSVFGIASTYFGYQCYRSLVNQAEAKKIDDELQPILRNISMEMDITGANKDSLLRAGKWDGFSKEKNKKFNEEIDEYSKTSGPRRHSLDQLYLDDLSGVNQNCGMSGPFRHKNQKSKTCMFAALTGAAGLMGLYYYRR